MRKCDEREPSFLLHDLKLPILNIIPSSALIANMHSPEHPSGSGSGVSTPPLQTSVSVPFKWEQQPGKPRPGTNIVPPRPEPTKCLELPPCRMVVFMDYSPTSVIDGPYINVGRPKFSSFRLFREGQDSYNSISSSASTPWDVLRIGSSTKKKSNGIGRYLFGKMKGGTKKVVDGGSSEERSCRRVKNSTCGGRGGEKMTRHASFSTVPHATTSSSHVWTSICAGLKQVILWKSSKKAHKEDQD